MVCRFRLVGRGRSDGCCAGPSKGGRGQLARMVWSPPWLRKNTGDVGFELRLRHTDTPFQRLTRRSEFRKYTFSTQKNLGGCRPADCLLMFSPQWSRLCCSCPMAPLAERLHNSVTLYSFSSGIAAIPSHPWLSLTSEHGGGGAPCRQKTLTIFTKTWNGRALQRAETPGVWSARRNSRVTTSRQDKVDEVWVAASNTKMCKLTNT